MASRNRRVTWASVVCLFEIDNRLQPRFLRGDQKKELARFAGCIRAEGERQLEEVRRTLCSRLKPPESRRVGDRRDRA